MALLVQVIAPDRVNQARAVLRRAAKQEVLEDTDKAVQEQDMDQDKAKVKAKEA